MTDAPPPPQPQSSPGPTPTPSDMIKIEPARAAALTSQLRAVSDRVSAAAAGRKVRLVAVSKLKPANDILALHNQADQLHFGENYAQELQQKAELLPRSIRWHFIGGLQSGHCKHLARIPNLWCVSSVDSEKKAQLLDRHRGESSSSGGGGAAVVEPLGVHVQVNTSGEAAKSGCTPGPETLALARLVRSLPNLRLRGFMTIGAIARSAATNNNNTLEGGGAENEDFVCLRDQRDMVAREIAAAAEAGGDEQPPLEQEELELSMGMSEDFEGAIALGSDEVRVGSTIFGARGAKSEAKIVE